MNDTSIQLNPFYRTSNKNSTHDRSTVYSFNSSSTFVTVFSNKNKKNHAVAGLGLRMSFPASSQSMAKSKRTSLALPTKMEGATTRRCMPSTKSTTSTSVEAVKNGWFRSEERKETSAVSGSPSQENAPMATLSEETRRTTRQRKAAGWDEEMISVRRRSNAFRSSQAT